MNMSVRMSSFAALFLAILALLALLVALPVEAYKKGDRVRTAVYIEYPNCNYLEGWQDGTFRKGQSIWGPIDLCSLNIKWYDRARKKELQTGFLPKDCSVGPHEKKGFLKTYDETHTWSGNWEVSACLLYTSPSPRDRQKSRMPSSA